MARNRKHDETTAQHFGAPGRPRLLAFWDGGSVSADLPTSGSVVIGRSRDCEVHIDHPSMSRRHVVVRVGEGVEVEDLGSANGTKLRGRTLKAHRAEPIGAGDVLEAGAVSIVVYGGGALPGERALATPAQAPPGMVVVDEEMKRLHRLVGLVAAADVPVLIRGETGVGKEVVAEALHQRSSRASGPFVTLNCAALPEPLMESELFGYEKGAFTGAAQTKSGVVEAAHGGTLFLDEIGELSAPAQAKLLRVLERREVTRVGGTQARAVDVRFVAATHRDLEAMVAEGSFRQDLFFRLDGFALAVPPLRERLSEIRPLAEAFIAAACARNGRMLLTLAPEAASRLEQHRWPGNVRELRNVIERAVLLARGSAVEPEHIVMATSLGAAPPPAPMSAPPPPPLEVAAPPSSSGSLRDEIGDIERRRILDVLEDCAGNQTRAAERLGISRRTLLSRLDEYGVKRPRKR